MKTYASVLDVPAEIYVASFHVSPSVGLQVLEQCAEKSIGRVLLNPGAESSTIEKRAQELGIEIRDACSIRLIGRAPSEWSGEA